ncbi:MAG: cell division protein ZapA [Bacteroidia bacterium]|nr:cell division protein ZapA [Bacteroidia bacterium]
MANNLGNIKIKVQIAGRAYPLTVDSADEEIVRLAAKQISEKVNKYSKELAFKDVQDSIAVVALDFAILYLKQNHLTKIEGDITNEIKQMIEKVASEVSLLEREF